MTEATHENGEESSHKTVPLYENFGIVIFFMLLMLTLVSVIAAYLSAKKIHFIHESTIAIGLGFDYIF